MKRHMHKHTYVYSVWLHKRNFGKILALSYGTFTWACYQLMMWDLRDSNLSSFFASIFGSRKKCIFLWISFFLYFTTENNNKSRPEPWGSPHFFPLQLRHVNFEGNLFLILSVSNRNMYNLSSKVFVYINNISKFYLFLFNTHIQ